MEVSDELAAAACAGNSEALAEIYKLVAPRLVGYLRARGSRDPEGLTSEVFLGVLPRLPGLTGGGSGLRALIFTVAHARIVDEHRKRGREPLMSQYVPDLDPRRDHSAEDLALQGSADDLLDQLSPDQRDVISLRIFGDLSLEQTAQALGKSVGAVKQAQRRGLAALRELLEGASRSMSEQTEALLRESGHDPEQFGAVGAYLDSLRVLIPDQAPEPSPELAAVMATAAPVARLVPRPSSRRRGLIVGGALAASVLVGTGAAAAADVLPDAVQRVVSDVGESLLPVSIPSPDDPQPSRVPTGPRTPGGVAPGERPSQAPSAPSSDAPGTPGTAEPSDRFQGPAAPGTSKPHPSHPSHPTKKPKPTPSVGSQGNEKGNAGGNGKSQGNPDPGEPRKSYKPGNDG